MSANVKDCRVFLPAAAGQPEHPMVAIVISVLHQTELHISAIPC